MRVSPTRADHRATETERDREPTRVAAAELGVPGAETSAAIGAAVGVGRPAHDSDSDSGSNSDSQQQQEEQQQQEQTISSAGNSSPKIRGRWKAAGWVAKMGTVRGFVAWDVHI